MIGPGLMPIRLQRAVTRVSPRHSYKDDLTPSVIVATGFGSVSEWDGLSGVRSFCLASGIHTRYDGSDWSGMLPVVSGR